ncbi:hypothetical protein [Chromobacterium violaceum]|uniref:hypothetical protein n=1 Tax=Chromobacterium violaceum TaxID=536 RepID=UPI00143D6C79|nr:hypothetical protein [Chromobacterium violaceum]QIY81471.1 hypothetical protein FOB43_20875 [Chromobacterium violaceum]
MPVSTDPKFSLPSIYDAATANPARPESSSAEDSLYEQLSADNHLLRQQLTEQGHIITALRAEVEQAEQLQRQLEARDLECEELRHALAIARLPPESRNNVIQLVRESAA